MALPLSPPVDPMLAKLSRNIPRDEGWLYEPKWDGFRAIAFRDRDSLEVLSRDGKPLLRYFPELQAALERLLPERVVVDGEVVVPGPRGLEFDALQLRIHPARSRIDKLAAETPSSFVAFDVLALGDDNLCETPLVERRRLLEDRLSDAVRLPELTSHAAAGDVAAALRPGPVVSITPQTADADVAAVWFDAFEGAGLDGLMAKRADSTYMPGKRTMLKIKHQRTAECVLAGYRLNKTKDGIGSLLLGLYDDRGVLQYVGHTSSFKAAERKALLREFEPLKGGAGFGGGRTPGGPSRWVGMTGRDTSFVPLSPVRVCEVTYDHLQGDRFRHAATFLRWREDKAPEECTFEQILPESRH